MTRYRKAEIERWIDDTQTATEDRCRTVTQKLAQERDAGNDLSEFIRSDEEGKDRLFAALFSGDFEYIRRASFEPDWTSWIENTPPYWFLSTNRQVVCDLIPKANHAEFEQSYGCSLSQLSRLIRRMPGQISFNVRNNSIQDYTDCEYIDALGEMLSWSRAGDAHFYRLQVIRDYAFKELKVNWEDELRAACDVSAGYVQLHNSLPKTRDSALMPVARDGTWPAPGQLQARLAYYRIARALWADARDPELDAWVDEGDIPDFSAESRSLSRLKRLFARLYSSHHQYTAQLTGALGGMYGLHPHEFNWIVAERGRETPVENPVPVGIYQWMFAVQAGLVGLTLDKEDATLTSDLIRPNDAEFNSFLDRVNINRHRLRETEVIIGELIEEINREADRTHSLRPTDLHEIGPLNDLFLKIQNGGVHVTPLVAAGAGAIAGGLSLLSGSVGPMVSAAIAGYSLLRCVPGMSEQCERAENALNRVCAKRRRRMVMSGAVVGLDIPQRLRSRRRSR